MSYKEKVINLFGLSDDGSMCYSNTFNNNIMDIAEDIITFAPLIGQNYPYCMSDNNQTKDKSTNISAKHNIVAIYSFDLLLFLKNMYNIKNKDDAFKWASITKNKYSVYRVLDSIWSYYSYDKNFINISITQFYVYFTNNYWINHIYDLIKEHMVQDLDKNKFKISKKKSKVVHNGQKAKEFISEFYINEHNMFNILLNFVEHNKSNKTNYRIHKKNIPDFIAESILKL